MVGRMTKIDIVSGFLGAGKPDVTGKICVIGSKLKEEKLEALFQK